MSVSRTWKSSWVAVALVVSLVAGSFVILAEATSIGGAFGVGRFSIEGLHGPVDVGAPLGFQLAVLDNKGDIVRSYKGTVEFWSSDPEAVVPSSYTFVRSDSGQHVFPIGSLVFNSPGNQTFTVFDVKKTKLSGTIEIYVEQTNIPPGGWSSPVSIGIGSSSGMYREVTIESNSLGYVAVAWSGSYVNGTWGVFANRYVPGVGWMGAEYLGLAQFPSYVCVGIDERGNVTVAWVNGNTVNSIRCTLAENLWEPVVVVSSAANTPRGLTMAVETRGMAVMAWQADEGATKGIYASTRRIGNVWSAPVLIESKTGYARDPDAAITDGGDAFVAFSVMNGSFENVCVNRYFAISNYWLGEITLYDRAYYSYLPKVSMDHYGNAFVVWDYCDGYSYMPYASVFRKGFGWGAPVQLDSTTSSIVTYPDVSAYGNCNAVVSWSIVSPDSRSIRTNRYVNGSAWLGPVNIASGQGNSFVTSVSADSSGSSYVVWCQNDGNVSPSGYRMNACVYNNSMGWSTPSIVAWIGNTSGFGVAAGPSDTAIMVWDEYGLTTDVWASTYGFRPPQPIFIDSTERVYFGVDMGSLGSNVYVLSYLYDYGPVLLYKSVDDGRTWGAPVDPFGTSFRYMEPGMCVYKDGASDTVLVASGGGMVAKSIDGGSIFSRLTDLPGYYWRFMAIGTNASWFGTAPDSDIYVVGSTSYSYGDLAITKSHDGGQTWTWPIIIDATGSCPQMVSDGSNLYVVYTSPIAYDGTLYVSKSSDWGQTWTTGKLLVAERPNTGNIRAYSFQYLDGQKALLTIRDGATTGAADNYGAYGYFDFSTMTYVEIARLPQVDWMVDEGLAGKLLPDGTLMLAWSKYTSGISSQLMFARLSGVVL